MATLPICRSCPKCGCNRYRSVKPKRLIAFAKDRQYKECVTRYTLPTPLWAKLIFIGIGTLLLAGCILSIVASLMRGHVIAIPGNALFAILGLACLGFGLASFSEHVIDAPAHAPRQSTPKNDQFEFLK